MSKTKIIVGFSGGIQSAYLAWEMKEKYGKENVTLLFHDTKSEPEDNYRFRRQVAKFLDIPITERSNGMDIWQVCIKAGIRQNSRIRKCSALLKKEPAEKYYKELEEQGVNFAVAMGFDKTEYGRRQRAIARNPNRKFIFLDTPLSKDAIKQEVISKWGICLPSMYSRYSRANCIPCFLGGKTNWFTVYRYNRPEFEKAKSYESEFNHSFNSDFFLSEVEPEFAWRLKQREFFSEEDFLPCECAA